MNDIQQRLIEIGAEIRRRREGYELTLAELAHRSGLTANFIGGVEMATREPSLTTILKICDGLQVDPGDLVANDKAEMTRQGLEAARLIDGLPGRRREPVLSVLRSLASISSEMSSDLATGILTEVLKPSEAKR
jgi:transcriptional regulator with XRE-family HTH domain